MNTKTESGNLTYARDCTDIFMHYLSGDRTTRSGVYLVYHPYWYHIGPDGVKLIPIYVYCDMKTAGGGWTVFQKRTDGSVDFDRKWYDYEHGFGAIKGEYWFGLRFINMLSTLRKNTLLIDMTTKDKSVSSYAIYNGFTVGDARSGYKLTVGCYTGNDANGNRLVHGSGYRFSTPDRDQDGNSKLHLAASHKAGFWFGIAGYSNLNGVYSVTSGATSIWWGSSSAVHVKGTVTMAFRPEHYH